MTMALAYQIRTRKIGCGCRNRFLPQLTKLEDRAVPSFGWASAVGGNSGNAVATDAAGDVYVTGSYSGSFTPAGSSVTLNSAGGTDIFVTKYSRLGTFQWAASMGGATNDEGQGIAVDSAGHVFVVGLFRSTAQFGSTNLTTPTTYPDAFLAKMDASTGSVSWARNGIVVSGNSANYGAGAGVAVDAAGNAYVSTTANFFYLAVTKITSSGSLSWQYDFDNAEAYSGAIAVSGSNVYVTGNFIGSVDFNPGPGSGNLRSNASAISGFVLKLTTAGSYVWARAFNGSKNSNCIPDSIGVDSAGNVYTSGNFTGSVDFNPGKGNLSLNGGTGAGFITKLNSSGNFVWAKQLGVPLGGETSFANRFGFDGAMTVDAAGSVYLTGGFTGTVDFNPGSGVNNLTSAGGADVFVSKLDTNGNFLWAIRAGSSADDFGKAIAVNSSGDIYVAGLIGGGTIDFDLTGSYADNRDLLATAGSSGFLWQIMQP